jgi:hypothetical protein
MSDFGTRLREHYEQISPPLDTERLTEQFIGADGYRRRRRPAVAMAAAALLTFLVIGTVGVMVLTGNSEPDVIETPQPSPPTTVLPPPESQNPNPDVFTFAEDNLCEWVSEEKVTSFVRSAYALSGFAWDGSVVAAAPEGSAWDLPGRDYCRWEPAGGGYVIARGLTPAQFGGLVEYSEIADRSGVLLDAVSGHPDIADGVIAASAAFGRYGFWLQGSDEVLGLEVVLMDSLTSPENGADGIDWLQQEKMLFHVANSFLRWMNWVPTIRDDLDWMSEFESVAVSGQGPVFVSSALEVASFDEAEGWALVDVDALPEGAGLEDLVPGRMITRIATGPEGELWVAGNAYSPLEDVQFGGSINWLNERSFTWLARRDCERDGCTWHIFGPDEIPALNREAGIGAFAFAADGTLYAVLGHNQLLVVSGSEGRSHAVPFLPAGFDGAVSPWARTLAVGADGLLWAGTNHGRGLVTFDGTAFTHVTTEDGLPSNSTSRVAAAADGTIWVATDESNGTTGVASFDGSGWTSYPDGSADPAESLFWELGVAVDADGVRWTVSSEGLTSFDGTTRQVHSIPFSSNSD